ncbi:MAG: 1-acyl-sn-glycerol-3-phosphate acyltransferase [Bacteroidales bacterium]
MEVREVEALKIDIDKVLRDKAAKYYRYIPRFVISKMERIIKQKELNELLYNNRNRLGMDFATGVIEEMNIGVEVKGLENIPSEGRFIFASNHPLGGLDGLALISHIGKLYDGKVKFLVNDILMEVKPLSSVFLPINKHGRQQRNSAELINAAYAGDEQMLIFPAGVCSRNYTGKKIEDLKWQKAFVSKSVEYERDIIPIFFEGVNSEFFYRVGRIRKRLGLKINIEMIYLPGEMIKSRNANYTIWIGKPIKYTDFKDKKIIDSVSMVRNTVYNLKTTKKGETK